MYILCSYFDSFLSDRIFPHDWEYKLQVDLYVPPKVVVTNTMFGTIVIPVGHYSGKTDSNGNPIPIEISKEDRLTTEEERDSKLEKLLK